MWIISFVDHDDPFYQVNNLPVYKLYCRSWEYSSERLDTGIEAIDAIETKRSTDFLGYEILAEQSGTYDQKIEFEWGTIYEFGVGDILLEDDSFVLGETETGFEAIILEDSDDYYTFVVIQEAYSLATQDPQSDNSFIDTAADAILDFTETNPFGEPTSSV